jgi:hypothetical protein
MYALAASMQGFLLGCFRPYRICDYLSPSEEDDEGSFYLNSDFRM